MSESFPAALPAVAPRTAYLTGLALAGAGAVFFSAKAIVAKLLYQHGADAVTVIALRMLLSAPLFLAVAVWTWRRGARVRGADLGRIVLLGLLGYYGSSMLDFVGLEYISAGLERLILFLTPTLVLVLGAWMFKRRVVRRQWWSMAFAYAGIVLVFRHDLHLGGARVMLGAGCVFGAAVLYAIYLLYSGELLRRVGTLRLVSLAMLASSVAGLVQFAVLRPLPVLFDQTASVWALGALLASVCTVLPVFLTMFAVARVGAGDAAQAGMIGPVSTLFLAWAVLGEPVTGIQLAGTALVLAGMFLLSARRVAPVAVTAAG